MSQTLLVAWSSFIKYGQPIVPGVTWLPRAEGQEAQSKYMVLNTTHSYMDRSQDFESKMDFWEKTFPC